MKKIEFSDMYHVEKYLFNKYLVKPVLNLGSGFGRIERKYEIDSVIDKYNDEAKESVEHFYKHDLSIVPYPVDKKFRTIICFGTAHYLRDPKILIKESHRLLEKGGYLLISFTHKGLANHWAVKYDYRIRHCGMSVKQFKKLIEDCGLKIVETAHNSWFNLQKLQWLWKIINHKRNYFVCLKK